MKRILFVPSGRAYDFVLHCEDIGANERKDGGAVTMPAPTVAPPASAMRREKLVPPSGDTSIMSESTSV